MKLDRNLQKRLRESVNFSDNFLFRGQSISYAILSKKGLIFNDKLNQFHSYGFLKNKNKNIFFQHWLIDYSKPFIFFLHGSGENSSTHQSFIYGCIKAGYNFISFDQIGYGDSDGIRGIIKSFDQYIETVELVFDYFYNKIKEKNKKPVFHFVGFSMGALQLLYYLIFYNRYAKNNEKINSIKSAILLAPYLKNHKRLINPFLELYLLIFNKCYCFTKILRENSQKEVLEKDVDYYINLYKNLTDNKNFLIRRKKDTRIHRLNSKKWLFFMIKAQNEIKKRIYYCSKTIKELKKFNIYFFINEKELIVDNSIIFKYAKNLNIETNIFFQKNFYHDFLDYEDERIEKFNKIFFDILKNHNESQTK